VNYKIGDKIKIVRRGKFDWHISMDRFIGQTFTISHIRAKLDAPKGGIYSVKENDWFWYEDSFIPANKVIKEYGIVKFLRSIEKK
jgi:hypothetical protein